jgi:hypothetical protein
MAYTFKDRLRKAFNGTKYTATEQLKNILNIVYVSTIFTLTFIGTNILLQIIIG